MIVYADRQHRVRTRELIAGIEQATDETERLIRYGQLEAGIDDGETGMGVPESITIKTPEGFAFYCVYPEHYREAALRWEQECQPAEAVVIGIRSIGATLGIVVAEALSCPVWRFTIRPHGHPYDRHVVLSEALSTRIREMSDAWFLVVDEGPGRSGSSFTAVAETLLQLGVREEKIVFFCSHDPDPSTLCSERARLRWPRHRRYWTPFDAGQIIPQGARDLSGGRWRELVFASPSEYPDVVGFHERRKYLAGGELWKFAGLAHIGRPKLERAEALGRWVPKPLRFENGFLISEWVEGAPVRVADAELVSTMREYLQYLNRSFPTGERVRYDELREMILVNTGVETSSRCAEVEEAAVIAGDGRMLPYEWLQTADGYVKTDALDHHCDHFFPGCQPFEWDIAGVSVEFGIDIESIHPFWKLAYLAFRIGYTSMFGKDRLRAKYLEVLADCVGGARHGLTR